jgi:hypothetical protein
VIWLDGGSIRQRGSVWDVVNKYLSHSTLSDERIIRLDSSPRPYYIEDDRLRTVAFEWLCDLPLQYGEPLEARIHFKTRTRVSGLAFGFDFTDIAGRRLLTYCTDFKHGVGPDISGPGTFSVDVAIDSLPLAPRVYGLAVGCRSGGFHSLDYVSEVCQLEVVAGPKMPGVSYAEGVNLECKHSWNL